MAVKWGRCSCQHVAASIQQAPQPLPRSLRRTASAFPLALALHDLEEALLAERWSQRAPRAASPTPALAARTDGAGHPRDHATHGHHLRGREAGLPGRDPARPSQPRHRPASLHGRGRRVRLHILGHLSQHVLWGGYSPGLVTVPLVEVPYCLRAWIEPRRAGVGQHQPPSSRRSALRGPGAPAGHVARVRPQLRLRLWRAHLGPGRPRRRCWIPSRASSCGGRPPPASKPGTTPAGCWVAPLHRVAVDPDGRPL
jgi:hypothetical protein